MYKIITKDQGEILAEKPVFVRIHSAGCYVTCREDQAEGVVVGGTPYLYADGNVVCEYDSGPDIMQAEHSRSAIESAMCEQDAATEKRISDIENALCEMDAAGKVGI